MQLFLKKKKSYFHLTLFFEMKKSQVVEGIVDGEGGTKGDVERWGNHQGLQEASGNWRW